MDKQNIIDQLINYIQAGYTTFYLQSNETARVEHLLSNVAEKLNFRVHELNLAKGKIHFHNKSVLKDNNGKIENSIQDLLDEDLEQSLILIKNAKFVLEHNPHTIALLQHLIEHIERHCAGQCAIILQSAEVYIPSDLEPFITLLDVPLPKEADIKNLILQKQADISETLLARLTTALSGLNELEIQKVLNLIHNKFNHIEEQHQSAILAEIQAQKEQIIAKSGVLEMVNLNTNIDDIGGLENLKKWLNEQNAILNQLEQAQAFGVKAPKGTLIAGMPGCGKSLTAKAAAALFQQPLLRLDIGSLLGKYVGESETNMRKALAMAESISPCVLWVDELEKAFVGMSGNNASEVSSRLLGYFLTWMQEKTAPVFIVATANDITALPPELLRKGRFDEIFYVGFPNSKERRKILEIHLNKAHQNPEKFNLVELAQQCRDYSGADIENAVYDAVKKAFLNTNKTLEQSTLLDSIQKTTPLRKTLKDKVGEYEKKFDELYLTPASEEDGLSIATMIKMAKNPNYLERLKVAQSEDVTEELLEELAKDEHLEVRKAVFINPVCSTKLLDEYVSLKDEHKLYNKEIKESISKHPNLSFDLGLKVFKGNDSLINNILNYNNLSHYNNENIVKLIEKELSLAKLNLLVKNKTLSDKIQSQIISSSLNKTNYEFWNEIKLSLLNNPALSFNVLNYLIKDESVKVREKVAELKTLTEEQQIKLSNDVKVSVRNKLALNPNLCSQAKENLEQHKKLEDKQREKLKQEEESILQKVQNDFLEKIGSKSHEQILSFFSKNDLTNKTQMNAIDVIANDPNIRMYNLGKVLARNPHLCEEAQLLFYEKCPWYQEEFTKNPNLCQKLKDKL